MRCGTGSTLRAGSTFLLRRCIYTGRLSGVCVSARSTVPTSRGLRFHGRWVSAPSMARGMIGTVRRIQGVPDGVVTNFARKGEGGVCSFIQVGDNFQAGTCVPSWLVYENVSFHVVPHVKMIKLVGHTTHTPWAWDWGAGLCFRGGQPA